MYPDIMELDDDAVKVKATFKKLLSYASAFSYDMERLDKEFASGKYGPEWTLSRWLISKCRISQTIAFRMIKDFNKTLSDDQRNRITAGIEAARQRKFELKLDRRAAQMGWDEWQAEEKARKTATQAAWDALWQAEKKPAAAKPKPVTKPTKTSAESLARMKVRRARLRAELQWGPKNPDLIRLLSECAKIEKTSRIELGRRYAAMKEIVDTRKAGKDENSKYWTWGSWASRYIERSRSSIKQCIADYNNSVLNGQDLAISQSDNVVIFDPAARGL